MASFDHKNRMSGLWAHFVPDHRDIPPQRLKKLLGQNRAERRANAKRSKLHFRNATNNIKTTMENGAGLVCDQALREFLLEYNDRNLSHGLGAMPASFNVIEAFTQFHATENWFWLLPEKDHLFLLPDFLDYATGADAPPEPLTWIAAMPEGVTHSYNAVGDLTALSFLHADGEPFVVGGISFIRFANELSWLLIGGTITDIDAQSERIRDAWSKARGEFEKQNKKHLDLSRTPEAGAVVLAGTQNAWRTLIYGRFDLGTQRHQVRYMARDGGAGYELYTDDPSVFPESTSGRLSNASLSWLEAGQAELNANSILTEIALACFALPAYFKFKVKLVRTRNQATRLAGNNNASSAQRANQHPPAGPRILFRTISSLEVVDPARAPVIRAYTPPRFRVEVEGFWRRLSSPEAVGRGPNGQPTTGRTWVIAHLRWRDKPPAVRTVYVKSSVALARNKAAALQVGAGLSMANVGLPVMVEPSESAAVSAGHLYVMRCPAMDADIYKVGWTSGDPEERAASLSQATGVPLFFVVVESWKVSDARGAEKIAHLALANYRLSERREFFKVPYSTIRASLVQSVPGIA